MLNSVAKSDIGKINLNEDRLNKLYNVTGLTFNTTSMAKHFPILRSKLGSNKPLKVKASISDAKIALGAFDSDVKIEYTLQIGWYLDLLGSPELLYDEIRMITAFNIKTHNDTLDIVMTDNKIKMDAQFGGRQAPIRNTLKMLNNEYREYLSQFGFAAYNL